ncbi:cytosine deaminase [Nocardia wallacei]|uniref:cytosine deaminase n=1 Tax=Nocardia wallacei TaxID=480035 RepID=UPI00245715F3|nr:cytosine deaminase [Nocardia wallacei]
MEPPLPQHISRLRGATLPDGAVVDIDIGHRDGHAVIAAIHPTAPPGEPADDILDMTGFVLLTAPAEPHAHLDKALSWDTLTPPFGDLGAAIESWRHGSATLTEQSFHDRATTAATTLLRNGTTAIRTHADILDGPDPLRAIRALDRVRRELAGLIDIQIVALTPPTAENALLHAALDTGADLVGGAPHIAPNPITELERLLDTAETRGTGIDLHVDEFLHGTHHTLAHYAHRVRTWPAHRTRTAGHCCRLGTMSPDELADLLPAVARSGLGIISLPITNLYLQGRDHPAATPRGLTALSALLDANIPVAAGADNVRDPFNPIGRSDALETAALLITAGHTTPAQAVHMVTDGAREVLGLPAAGTRVGARAELLAVRGTGLVDIIANAPADRIVIRDGAIVSISRTDYRTAGFAVLETS